MTWLPPCWPAVRLECASPGKRSRGTRVLPGALSAFTLWCLVSESWASLLLFYLQDSRPYIC